MMDRVQEQRKAEILKKLKELKASKAWLEGDRKAEAEVARVREELHHLEMEALNARERILAKCDFQQELEDTRANLAKARQTGKADEADKLSEHLKELTA